MEALLEDAPLIPLLVLSNKQDLPGARTAHEVAAAMNLNNNNNNIHFQTRLWYIHSTCARTGEGVREAFGWLVTAMDRVRTRAWIAPEIQRKG